MNPVHRLTAIWLVLLAATGLTYGLGEMDRAGGLTLALTLLFIAFVKSHLVAGHFMGLKDTSRFWRGLMLGWLLLVLTLIAIAFRMGSHT